MKLVNICPFVRQALSIKIGGLSRSPYRMVKTRDCRLFYINGGDGVIIIEDTEYKICNGSCIVLKAGTEYMIMPNEGSTITLLVANFDYTQSASHISQTFSPIPSEIFSGSDITDAVEFEDCDALNAPVILQSAYILESRMRLLVTERQIGNKYCNELLSSLLKSVVLSVVRQIEHSNGEVGTKQSLLVRMIIGHIQNYYTEPLSNAELTKYFHYNAIYINRVFKKHTGTTVQQFLTNYRLQMSAEFLKSSDSPISEIATMTGFEDMSYFSKLFKKAYGMSPSHYRMNM